MLHFLFVSDSFKGSLTSEDTARLLTQAARSVFPDCACEGVPVADGGEGTAYAVAKAEGGSMRTVTVNDPLFRPVEASYAILPGDRAVIEMAAASGLPLLQPAERDPLRTTTYGTGELIRDALEQGYTDIAVAIGGSATNDGGIGCLRALGARLLDKDGNELEGRGEDLQRLASLDLAGLDPRLQNASLTVMCDVQNVLCGPDGATFTFGPQKGANTAKLAFLEEGMLRYQALLKETCGKDCALLPGTGAAGGLGAALSVVLGGTLRSGICTVLDLIHFKERLEGTDLVITGEGRTDWQSAQGKVMAGVGEAAAAAGIPVVGICGGLGKGAMDILDHGISSLMTTVNAPMTLDEAIGRASELYLDAARRTFLMLKAGMQLKDSDRSMREFLRRG